MPVFRPRFLRGEAWKAEGQVTTCAEILQDIHRFYLCYIELKRLKQCYAGKNR